MKNLTWLKESYIAHRGLHSKDGSIPENSLLAYEKAIEKGYAIELDINVLKDGTVVAFHDYNLKRLCHDDRLLSDLTRDDLNNLRLLDSDQKIATLEEVLTFVANRVPLLIELKPHGNVVLLLQSTMKILERYSGSYAIFSFHPRVVYWLKRHFPHVIRGQIAESFQDDKRMNRLFKSMMKNMVFNVLTKPDFISYGIRDLPNKKLDRMKQKGRTIISYAAKNQKEFDFVKKYYHNVVFEYFEPKRKG